MTALTADVTSFRSEVADFCRSWAGIADPYQVFKDRSGVTADIYRALGERGWLTMCWPLDVMGQGRPPVFEFVLWDELARSRLARPSLAAGIVAKSLVAHGTPEQRAALLPGIGAGTYSLALGYSEPEAGSDLNGLRCRAHRDGETYVVNGEKRWTSDAHHADAIWLLARTGPLAERAKALTLFVVDRRSPGVTVTPIETLDGHQLNEVHFDDVVLPVDRRIGEEGQAWPIIQRALAQERHLQVLPGRLKRDLEDLVAWATASDRTDNAHLQSELAEIVADLDLVEAGAEDLLKAMTNGDDTTVAAARQKLIGTELMQRMARLPAEHGDAGAVCDGSPFELLWRQSILETIAGGTTEIMRDLIARRALGLGATPARSGSDRGSATGTLVGRTS